MSGVIPGMLASLLASCLLCGCSRNDQPQPGVASQAPATLPEEGANDPHAAAPTVPAEHPCGLLTDSDVDGVFQGATAGKRDDSLDKYGIATCVWDLPTDRFVVQLLKADSSSVADELRGRASGSADPTMQGAMQGVRFETMTGVGDEAMAIVEKADATRGILSDTAVLVMQRGERRAVLFTGTALAGGDRTAALESLKTLGRSAAARL